MVARTKCVAWAIPLWILLVWLSRIGVAEKGNCRSLSFLYMMLDQFKRRTILCAPKESSTRWF
jgi:hypothetical protein